MSTKNNGNNEKSINDNISSSTPTTTMASNINSNSVPNRKKPSRKASKNGQNVNSNSYEHHLEKWLENTSKMNFDYNNLDGNWSIMNASNGAANRKGNNNHLQYSSADPISLPAHMNLDSSPSISAFMNFNTPQPFRQYPHLAQRQQSASPISNNDPLTSLSTQPDFFSLPSFGLAKVDKLSSSDQEKLNDVISQSKRFNDLLIDDTPRGSSTMNALNNSARLPPNESSAEDELDDEGQTDEEQNKNENGANVGGGGDGKSLLHTLVKQIQLLHETNSKLFRSLHETKVEMEALKYAPSWGLRHRRDSVSGLSVHSSQPFGGHYPGISSPAPTYHSQGGSYTPGIVTDMVREVREAGRVRDESLMNRVKALIEEKSWTHNETNMRVLRELEEVKVHLHNFKIDRQTMNDRMAKLEDEVRSVRAFLSVNNSFQQQPVTYSQYATPNSNLAMNDQIKRSNMSLNYGVISNNMASGVDGFQFSDDHQNFRNRPSQSPPKRHDNSLNETDEESFDKSHVIQMEKDTVKLRRDLQDALAGRKHAESRILALEHMVTSLKSPSQTTNLQSSQHVSINNNKNSLPSEFQQPQQHQLQIQINGGDAISKQQQIRKSSDQSSVGKLVSPPKGVKATQVTLSAAGPITDL